MSTELLISTANNSMETFAAEGAKSGFFSGMLETAKSVVANNPVAVAAGVTAIGVAGLMWYGYKNWGWFADEPSATAEDMYTAAEVEGMIKEAMAIMIAQNATAAAATAPAVPVAPVPAAPVPAAPAAQVAAPAPAAPAAPAAVPAPAAPVPAAAASAAV